jgi:hypothetical protein
MKHQEKYEEKKQKNFNCMTNHNGKTPQPESMASDFYFLLHQRCIISKTEIENSPSKRESGKKSQQLRDMDDYW